MTSIVALVKPAIRTLLPNCAETTSAPGLPHAGRRRYNERSRSFPGILHNARANPARTYAPAADRRRRAWLAAVSLAAAGAQQDSKDGKDAKDIKKPSLAITRGAANLLLARARRDHRGAAWRSSSTIPSCTVPRSSGTGATAPSRKPPRTASPTKRARAPSSGAGRRRTRSRRRACTACSCASSAAPRRSSPATTRCR